MTEYLGISMVVIVATLCIAILSTIVTENIFKQIEAHRNRSWDRWWAGLGKFIATMREKYKDDMNKILDELKMKTAKKTMEQYDELIEKVHQQGMKVEDIDLDLYK